MLLIITPNPALDRTMIVPDMHVGGVLRAERVIVAAGGKGLNVARAAHSLGTALLVCAPLGGLTGQLLAQRAAAEGIAGRWSWHAAGETRTCVLVVSPGGGDATALNERGPPLGARDWQHFVELVLAEAPACRMATISGSLPPGVAPQWLGDLIGHLRERGTQTIVDTSGPALEAAIRARPYGLKVNGAELGAILGRPLQNVAEALQALDALRSNGIELPAVSLGALGAVAANGDGCWWACPPPIDLLSSIGSGDSLLAGLASGLLRGAALPEALALGVACGSADALTIGGGLIDMATVERLRAGVTVQRL